VTAGPSVPAATGELTRSRPRAEPYSAWFGDNCRWEHAGQPFFSGEVEPCINGMVIALGTYFDQDVDGVVARLVGEQLEDGDGRPSRWNTLRALRVLNWYGRSAG
jgi:hypothetical protein